MEPDKPKVSDSSASAPDGPELAKYRDEIKRTCIGAALLGASMHLVFGAVALISNSEDIREGSSSDSLVVLTMTTGQGISALGVLAALTIAAHVAVWATDPSRARQNRQSMMRAHQHVLALSSYVMGVAAVYIAIGIVFADAPEHLNIGRVVVACVLGGVVCVLSATAKAALDPTVADAIAEEDRATRMERLEDGAEEVFPRKGFALRRRSLWWRPAVLIVGCAVIGAVIVALTLAVVWWQAFGVMLAITAANAYIVSAWLYSRAAGGGGTQALIALMALIWLAIATVSALEPLFPTADYDGTTGWPAALTIMAVYLGPLLVLGLLAAPNNAEKKTATCLTRWGPRSFARAFIEQRLCAFGTCQWLWVHE